MTLAITMLLALLPPSFAEATEGKQDAIQRTCDVSKTESAEWCRTCDSDPTVGKHDGHETAKVTVCVKKIWTNG